MAILISIKFWKFFQCLVSIAEVSLILANFQLVAADGLPFLGICHRLVASSKDPATRNK